MTGNTKEAEDEIEKIIKSWKAMGYKWKYQKNGCWNDICDHYKDGICQNPKIPVKIGCPATQTFYIRRLFGAEEE